MRKRLGAMVLSAAEGLSRQSEGDDGDSSRAKEALDAAAGGGLDDVPSVQQGRKDEGAGGSDSGSEAPKAGDGGSSGGMSGGGSSSNGGGGKTAEDVPVEGVKQDQGAGKKVVSGGTRPGQLKSLMGKPGARDRWAKLRSSMKVGGGGARMQPLQQLVHGIKLGMATIEELEEDVGYWGTLLQVSLDA